MKHRNQIKEHGIFQIYTDQRKRLFTKSILKPAKSHFGERIVRQGSSEFREWDPKRSKLAASVRNGCPNTGIREGNVILYLGASHGFTCSYVSDMVGKEGLIFGIDPAPEVMRDLVFLSKERTNIVPILADANHPNQYKDRICQADVVFQDIAQKNQAEIFLKNCDLFLKENGFGLISVKARSINIKKRAKEIFQEVRDVIEKKYLIVDYRDLDPHEKDHCMIIIKKKPSNIQNNIKKEKSDSKNKNKRDKEAQGKKTVKKKNRRAKDFDHKSKNKKSNRR